jgi:hypothetical protein
VSSSTPAPNFFLHEIFDEFNEPWERDIVTLPVAVTDGYVAIPETPGLGIDLNPKRSKAPLPRRTLPPSSNLGGSAAKAEANQSTFPRPPASS